MDIAQQHVDEPPVAGEAGDAVAAVAAHHDQVLEYARGIDALAGKVICTDVVLGSDLPRVMAAVAAGDERETVKLQAANTVAGLLEALDPPPPRCLGCNSSVVGHPYAVLVVSAGTFGSPFLAGPVCTACGTEPDAIRQAALPTLRTVWPGFRLLPPAVDAVGHA